MDEYEVNRLALRDTQVNLFLVEVLRGAGLKDWEKDFW